MLENTAGPINNGQSKETDRIGYTRRKQEKQIRIAICVGHQFTQANTYNVNSK